MVDEKDRKEPRFPNARSAEVKELIRQEIVQISENKDEKEFEFIGIAGGACRGDIIFHEVCKELGIRSEVLLALPAEKFIPVSVRRGGNEWVDRFNALEKDPEIEFKILSQEKELPKWMGRDITDYTFWRICASAGLPWCSPPWSSKDGWHEIADVPDPRLLDAPPCRSILVSIAGADAILCRRQRIARRRIAPRRRLCGPAK